jgi:hypothetical protein
MALRVPKYVRYADLKPKYGIPLLQDPHSTTLRSRAVPAPGQSRAKYTCLD